MKVPLCHPFILVIYLQDEVYGLGMNLMQATILPWIMQGRLVRETSIFSRCHVAAEKPSAVPVPVLVPVPTIVDLLFFIPQSFRILFTLEL